MKCKLDNKSKEVFNKQVNNAVASSIFNSNNESVPNIGADFAIKEGDVLTKEEADNLAREIINKNLLLNISSSVNFNKVGELYIIDSFKNNFESIVANGDLIANDDFIKSVNNLNNLDVSKDNQYTDAESGYYNEAQILDKTIDSISNHELDVVNAERLKKGAGRLKRHRHADSQKSPEVVKSEFNEELQEQIDFVEKKLGITIRTTSNVDYSGKVEYLYGKPLITLSIENLRKDTLMHEAIGHIYINAIGGLSESRVRVQAERLAGKDATDQEKLEAVADAVGRKAYDMFNAKEHKSSFKRFLDWMYNRLSKIFKTSRNELEMLAAEGLTDYKAYKNLGYIPAYVQYQKNAKLTNKQIKEKLANTRNPSHEAYIKFDEENHEYWKNGKKNTLSASEFSDEYNGNKSPEWDSVHHKINQHYIGQFSNKLPFEWNLAIKRTFNKGESFTEIRHLLRSDSDLFSMVKDEAEKLHEQYALQTEFGTHLHGLADKFFTSGHIDPNPKYEKFYADLKRMKMMYESKGYSLMPEVRIFDPTTGIAGSIDLLLFNEDTGEFMVIDFKSRMTELDENGNLKKSIIDEKRRKKYMRQTLIYKNLLEKLYGIKSSGVGIKILDFDIDYENTSLEDKEFSVKTEVAPQPEVPLHLDEIEYEKANYIASKQTGNSVSGVSNTISSLTETYRKVVDSLYNKLKNNSKDNVTEGIIENIEAVSEEDEFLGVLEYLKQMLGYKYEGKEFHGEINEFLDQVTLSVAETVPSINTLAELNNKADEFAPLADVLKMLKQPEYKNRLKEDNNLDLIKDVQAAINKVANAKEYILKHSTDSLATLMAGLSDAHFINNKERLRKQFIEDNPPVSGGYKLGDKIVNRDIWKSAQRKFIVDNLDKAMTASQVEAREFWTAYLKDGYFDTPFIDKLLQDAGNTRSLLIQNVNKRFNQVEMRYREDVNAKAIEYDDKVKEYAKKHGLTVFDLGKQLIETDKDGNPTGFLVGKYKSELYTEFSKLQNDLYIARSSKTKDGLQKAKDAFDAFLKENIVDGKPIKKWENSNYKKHSEILNYLHETILDSDKALGFNKALMRSPKVLGATFYKLPQKRAESSEHRMNNHFKKWGKEKLNQIKMKRLAGETDVEAMPEASELKDNEVADDVNAVKVKTSANGLINRNVPILFREDLDLNEQTADIFSSILDNYGMSVNYREKSSIQPEIELLLEVVKNTQPMIRDGITKKLVNASSKFNTPVRTGELSNEYHMLKSMIEQRLYGMNFKRSELLFGMDKTKLSKSVNQYTANLLLIGNYMSGTINLFQGEYTNFLNSVHNEHFTTSGLMKAQKDFWGDASNWMDDVGENVSRSRTSQMLQLFDIQGEFEIMSNPYIRKNLFRKIINRDQLYFMNTAGEFMLEGTLMYGALNSIKIRNTKGEWIGKDGKIVDSKDKAASLNDALDVKDGKLVKKIEFTHTSLKDNKPYSHSQISSYLKGLANDLHGQYDGKMKSTIQRTAGGHMVTLMRRWMVRTIDQRWRGINYSLTDMDDLDIMQKGFDEQLGVFKEGNYTSTIRFVHGMIKSLKSDKRKLQFKTNWEKLSDRQKSGVMKTVIEAGIIALTLSLASLAKSFADDEPDEDKKKYLLLQAYLLRRFYSELAFYTNPAEAYRILKSPMASMGMLDSIIRFLGQLMADPTADYQRGAHKGDNKAYVYLKRVLPMLKQIDNFTLKTIEDKVKLQTGQNY